jgi:hypothetical protein
MALSPEMKRYVTTGHCPHCDVVILDADYIRRNSARLKVDAAQLNTPDLFRPPINLWPPSFVPSGARVRYVDPDLMQW